MSSVALIDSILKSKGYRERDLLCISDLKRTTKCDNEKTVRAAIDRMKKDDVILEPFPGKFQAPPNRGAVLARSWRRRSNETLQIQEAVCGR